MLLSLRQSLLFFLLILGLGNLTSGQTQELNGKDLAIYSEQGCLSDYADYTKQLGWKVGLTLPIGVASTFLGMIPGALIGSSLGQILDPTNGWGDLAYGIEGAAVTGLIGLAVSAGFEAFYITKLVQVHYMKKVLEEMQQGQGKSLEKFYKKYFKRYPADATRVDQGKLRFYLADFNSSGRLCDGLLKRKAPKARHLRKKRYSRLLANFKDVAVAIHKVVNL